MVLYEQYLKKKVESDVYFNKKIYRNHKALRPQNLSTSFDSTFVPIDISPNFSRKARMYGSMPKIVNSTIP